MRSTRHTKSIGSIPLLLVTALVLLAAGCGGGGSEPAILHPEDFLPPGTDAMKKNGVATTATDVSGLEDIVNGGFEVYVSNGFREMVAQDYAGTVGGSSTNIRVWIFDQGTAENEATLNEELVLEGTWERASVDERFELTQSDGSPVVVPAGRLWISIFPSNKTDSWQ